MHILVLNPGSSSIKFSMHEVCEGAREARVGAAEYRSLYAGELGGIGGRREKLEFRDAAGNDLSGRLGAGEARLDGGSDCGSGARGGAG